MSIERMQYLLAQITSKYFAFATVVWANGAEVKAKVPFVTLKLGDPKRTARYLVNEYGERYYQMSCTLEVNLYTEGAKVGMTYMNTAVPDLIDFANYMESDAVTERFSIEDMSIIFNTVRDLSELVDARKYQYRAMAEFTLSFVTMADNIYGVSGNEGHSGGDGSNLSQNEIPVIEEVEI